MKIKNQILIALMLITVTVFMSLTPVFAADIQAAYSKMPDHLLSTFDAAEGGTLDVIVWLEDDSTAKYQAAAANVVAPAFSQNSDVSAYSLQSVTETQLTEEERMAQIEAMQNYIMEKRLIAQAIYLEDNTAKAEEISSNLSDGEIVYISKYSPLVIYNVDKSDAVNIAMCNTVLSLTDGSIEGENSAATASEIIGADDYDPNGYAGQGIKIGMIESNTPDTTLSCFSDKVNKITCDDDYAVSDDKDHASLVAAIMVGDGVGVAQGVDHLYSYATDTTAQFIENVESLLTDGVNVINISWTDNNLSQYNEYAQWLEHVVYSHSAHCVIASGNTWRHVANIGMAYNVMTVGAIDDKGTVSHLGDTLYHIDQTEGSGYYRENIYTNKPEICAPGVDIEVYENGKALLVDYNSGERYNTGTSFAAPYVSGAMAMLCSTCPDLLDKPALMKSILSASVSKQSPHNYASSATEYNQYGSGMLNVQNAKLIAVNETYVNDTISSGETWHQIIGAFDAGDTVTISLSYLRSCVVMSFDHTESEKLGLAPLANLNIFLCPLESTDILDCVIGSISTVDNTKKIICQIPTSGSYKIVVQRTADSDTGEVRFGVSWLEHSAGMP